MSRCGYCGTTILFGGVRDGDAHFCNNQCYQNAQVLVVAQQVPPEVLDRAVDELFRGDCPRCQRRGPVDVHKVHRVWSAVFLTNWSSTPQVCCRSCATKSQLGGLCFSLLLGWWGFPWGLVLTPVQVVRNIVGMVSGPNLAKPSVDLRKLVAVGLGSQVLASAQANRPSAT